MNKAALNELIKAEPFVPFVLEMSNGRSFTVRHPEFIICTKHFVIVYDPQGEHIGNLSYLHIANAQLVHEQDAASA